MHRIDPMNREGVTAILMDFCHTKLRFQEKNILGTSLEKSKTTHAAKKIQFNYTLVRIVRYRIARTRLIPL